MVSLETCLNASVGTGKFKGDDTLLSGPYLTQIIMARRVLYPLAKVFFLCLVAGRDDNLLKNGRQGENGGRDHSRPSRPPKET